jgi:hypothetical protein
MSLATKAKALAGEDMKGGAEVGKMSLINKLKGQNPKKPVMIVGFIETRLIIKSENAPDMTQISEIGGLARHKRPC